MWILFINALLCLDFTESVSFYGPIWSYDDEGAWPGGFCKKGGKRQSPIDIQSSNVVRDYEKQFIKYGSLQFIGYENVLLTGLNNGHTIQFSTEGDRTMHPTIRGGPLKYLYRLEQLHFHWLSEHSINGVKYPMEIHFVHVRADLKVSEALHKRDGLAIISVFCNVQSELDKIEKDMSIDLMDYISQLMRTGDRLSGLVINLRKFLSPHLHAYYTYLGSLTSPECNEVVVWIIFEKPIHISDKVYRLFGKVGIGRHNFRSQQKINHHLVFQPPDPFITTPRAVQVMNNFLKMVSQFFKNVTRYYLGLSTGRRPVGRSQHTTGVTWWNLTSVRIKPTIGGILRKVVRGEGARCFGIEYGDNSVALVSEIKTHFGSLSQKS